MLIYCICTQYLVGAPYALITASIRRGMEVISLWHCWGGMEAQVALTVAFRSFALLGLVSLIFLLTIPLTIFPVAQMVEHGTSNANIMGSIPRESKSW